MYVNRETGKPVWLVSQGGDGVTYSDGARRHSAPSHEFFGAHREPTAAELSEHAREAKHERFNQRKPAKPRAPRKTAAKAEKTAKDARATSQAMQQGAKPEAASTANSGPPKAHVTVEPLK